MKKALRILGIGLLVIVLAIFSFYLIKNEKLPQGESGERADALAMQMMESLNKAAWEETEEVSWTFKGMHSYTWNKTENVVNVKWDENEVQLDPESISGIVMKAEAYSAKEVQGLIKTAWDYFNNDSFWLCAPFKAFDPGTERSIVQLKDGSEGLMVTYTSGGSTPGDSYLWILDENHRPVALKMWVSILPIGGIEFTWENYLTLESGAMIAQDHFLLGAMNIDLTSIK
ncbi:MAG: hypothetical protein ACJAZV_002229 [Roseivirga sp.]|jgi:hypothetical protein